MTSTSGKAVKINLQQEEALNTPRTRILGLLSMGILAVLASALILYSVPQEASGMANARPIAPSANIITN